MINSLKAEFRKLLTVRSTYFLTLIAFLIGGGLIGFWIYGYKDVQHSAVASDALLSSIYAAVSVIGVLLSFVAVLLVGHEYRYSTIMYSLTSANRRTKVFVAKLLALACVSLVITAVLVAANILLFYTGQHAHGIHMISQHVPIWETVWRSVATILGDIAFAFIIAILVRSLIGAIAVILVLPTTIENLLTLVLHDNTKYLPYTALGNMTDVTSKVSFTFSLVVSCVYAVVVGLVAYGVFLKRDAN